MHSNANDVKSGLRMRLSTIIDYVIQVKYLIGSI